MSAARNERDGERANQERGDEIDVAQHENQRQSQPDDAPAEPQTPIVSEAADSLDIPT